MKTEKIVMTRKLQGPGGYHKAAIVLVDREVLPEGEPKMIALRSTGLIEIIEIRNRLYKGKTKNCAFWRAVEELREKCEDLNRSS